MKDKYYNKYLNVKNRIRKLVKFKGNDLTTSYPTTIFHNFKNFSNEELELLYYRKQTWGDYHPDYLNMWYDPNASYITTNGLEHHITSTPYTTSTGEVIPNGIGLVKSKFDTSYGIYEWSFKLPEGSGLWPAIWLGVRGIWPPEIDVIEGYSNSKGYSNKCETNFHFGLNSKSKYTAGAEAHGFLINEKELNTVVLDLQKDSIKIYYNNYLVRRITNIEFTTWFSNNPNMLIIMGTGLRKDMEFTNTSPMIIESFKYSKQV